MIRCRASSRQAGEARPGRRLMSLYLLAGLTALMSACLLVCFVRSDVRCCGVF